VHYETPQLTALSATNAIHTPGATLKSSNTGLIDGLSNQLNDRRPAYADWED
jgi:hypothetical protein